MTTTTDELAGKTGLALFLTGFASMAASLYWLTYVAPGPGTMVIVHVIGTALCFLGAVCGWATHGTTAGKIAAYGGSLTVLAELMINTFSV